MKTLLLLLSFISVLLLVGASHDEDRTTLYQRVGHPDKWNHVGEATDKNEVMKFYVALKQRNLEKLDQILWDVSHPHSPKYGQHLTYDEIMEEIAPSDMDRNIVTKWLVLGGVEMRSIVSVGDSLVVKAPVRVIESLFHTEVHIYSHKLNNRRILAHTGELSVPTMINEYIDLVTALSFFPPERHISDFNDRGFEQLPNASYMLLPSQLRKIYNVPEGLRATNASTTQAAVEFEWPGCFSYPDLAQFQSVVGFPSTNVSRIIPEDEWTDTACDGESALDIQMMSTSGSGAQTWYFTNEFWIYEFAITLMQLDNPPLVTSLSWGWMEADSCQIGECSVLGVNSFNYVARTNTELKKAGAMGLSVIVCTQDEGAPSDNNDDCSLDESDYPVWPIYPASSPWVTAVGATTVYGGPKVTRSQSDDSIDSTKPLCQQIMCNNGTEEKVAMSSDFDTFFTSGGGFSNWTARPSYQDAAVKGYLSGPGMRPLVGKFGVNNRGYPDVSAAGCQVLTIQSGVYQWEGGTSASTPIFSGIISLLNDYRLNHGKKPLGFLNYMLYEMAAAQPTAFNSITVGNNTCTGWFMDTCCEYGYSAVDGWNPAVGFGTPNFQVMLEYISKLP